MNLRPRQEEEVERIKRLLCRHYDITMEQMMQSNRGKGNLAHVRMLAMYLAREQTSLALWEVAKLFNRRSHRTVSYACQKVQETILTNPKLNGMIQKILDSEEQSE